ncbi:hypothetical protein [Catenuloplanes indicus]|uniref:Uncharacterized protein n=1 Tax=Catenuloplanes indicus TaxID=137267 RepID=A0AAE3VWT9_9ACTN|nr:hypothetical protein [Catenuloplanes indicus]MDQ0365453.1 hypothetical protein [Catenuloplanes indicus]
MVLRESGWPARSIDVTVDGAHTVDVAGQDSALVPAKRLAPHSANLART